MKETDIKYALWELMVTKKITKQGDVLYGVLYLPPENSIFN